jgi:hypothetical protein
VRSAPPGQLLGEARGRAVLRLHPKPLTRPVAVTPPLRADFLELGPVMFPAYASATAGVWSLTDGVVYEIKS